MTVRFQWKDKILFWILTVATIGVGGVLWSQHATLASIETSMSSVQTDVGKHAGDVVELLAKIHRAELEIAKLRGKNETLDAKLEAIQEALDRIRARHSPP